MNQVDKTGNNNQIDLNFKFNLKTLIVILLFAIGLYFLVPKLIGLPESLMLILQVDKFYLLLAIGFEILSYVGASILLGIILLQLGYKIKFWDRFRMGSIAAFAIHFFPVGTLGQGAVDFFFLRKEKVETGSVLLMMILRIIFTYAAFLMIFLYGLVLVPTAPHLKISPRIISIVLATLIIGGIGYMIYLYQNKTKFRKSWNWFLRFFDKIISKIRGHKISQEKETEVFEDIYRGIGLFGQKKRSSVFALLAGLMYWLGDLMCCYFVFLGFGYHIHIGVLIFGYGVASLLGMVSFIPGGLGVTEGTMGLLYSALGVPSALAVMSILVFRIFSFWIWIPFGLYSFISLNRQMKN